MIKYEYDSEEKKKELLEEHSELYLVEEQNLFSGNFLVFSKEPPKSNVIYSNVPKKEFDELRQVVDILLGGGKTE